MSNTVTKTVTYTKTDVGKTFESFRSNLRMMCMSARVEAETVDARADDVLAFAYAGYLKGVDVILYDAKPARIRAARFMVSEDAAGWACEMPGDNVWPVTSGGSLTVIVHYAQSWFDLSESRKSEFRKKLKVWWGPTKEDTTFGDMDAAGTRRYASNAYGLEQNTFKRRGDA